MSIEKNRLLMEQQIQKLKGQLNEAKIKKGSIVIAKKGIHKGDKHTVIHDFGNGTYNIMPVGYKNKYRLGAAGAKASELELVKEDQLNENYRFTLLEQITGEDLILTIKANVDPAYIDKKTALKKLMPVIKKLFIGQVIPDDYENPNNESGKTLKKVFINPDWGGHPTLWIEVQLTSGKILKLRYSL